VIARGALRASGPLESVLGSSGGPLTRVRAAGDGDLRAALSERGIDSEGGEDGALLVRAEAARVGEVALEARVALAELVAVSRSLEEAFFELTGGEG
jgi:ABC-2 type transport system ATP-binding protein